MKKITAMLCVASSIMMLTACGTTQEEQTNTVYEFKAIEEMSETEVNEEIVLMEAEIAKLEEELKEIEALEQEIKALEDEMSAIEVLEEQIAILEASIEDSEDE